MIPNQSRHIYAEFTTSSDDGDFPLGYVPVVGWSEDGDALVAHPKKAKLAPASHYPNFDRLTWDNLAIEAAFTAPPGYTVTDLDGTTPLPVVGFAVVPGSGVHPLFLGTGGEILLETDNVVITPPDDEKAIPTPGS